jgi:hypothetical protein
MLRAAQPFQTLCCQTERHFSLAKIAAIKLQKHDLKIRLLDSQGRIIRQVVTKTKEEEGLFSEDMSSAQLAALKALEKALQYCHEQKVVIVGFSDSLVGIPGHLESNLETLSSTAAVEIETSDAYRGVESEF